jgi:hypothetical protein
MVNGLMDDYVVLNALKAIAVGKVNCGLPLNRHEAQRIARQALVAIGEPWPAKPQARRLIGDAETVLTSS